MKATIITDDEDYPVDVRTAYCKTERRNGNTRKSLYITAQFREGIDESFSEGDKAIIVISDSDRKYTTTVQVTLVHDPSLDGRFQWKTGAYPTDSDIVKLFRKENMIA